MGAFDKSYHDILKKYVEITEQRYQVIDTTTGKAVGFTDQPPTQPAVAQTTQTPTPAAGQIATTPEEAEPSEEQKKTFQRLHGTPYNPKSQMDKNKMQVQRQAETSSGGDFNKLKQAVYSGNNVNPLNAGKPGQPTGKNILIGGQGDMPARQVNLNTGQSTEVPRATPAFKPDPSVTAAKATGVPVGTTPAQFDARRVAQTGTTRPASPTTTTSAPPKPAAPAKTVNSAPRRNRNQTA